MTDETGVGPMWIQEPLIPLPPAGSAAGGVGGDRWWVRTPPVAAWTRAAADDSSTSDQGEEAGSDVDSPVMAAQATG
jgi:hypothetical protein